MEFSKNSWGLTARSIGIMIAPWRQQRTYLHAWRVRANRTVGITARSSIDESFIRDAKPVREGSWSINVRADVDLREARMEVRALRTQKVFLSASNMVKKFTDQECIGGSPSNEQV